MISWKQVEITVENIFEPCRTSMWKVWGRVCTREWNNHDCGERMGKGRRCRAASLLISCLRSSVEISGQLWVVHPQGQVQGFCGEVALGPALLGLCAPGRSKLCKSPGVPWRNQIFVRSRAWITGRSIEHKTWLLQSTGGWIIHGKAA